MLLNLLTHYVALCVASVAAFGIASAAASAVAYVIALFHFLSTVLGFPVFFGELAPS